MTTLDAYDQAIDVEDPDAVAPLEEAEITLGGKVYHLREVADIEITGGLDGLGEDEDEDDEDEEPSEACRRCPTGRNARSPNRSMSSGFFLESARDSRIIDGNRLHRRPRATAPRSVGPARDGRCDSD